MGSLCTAIQKGHGDWCTCLEKYTLCRDGMYHKRDQFGRLLPTFIQVINFTEQEESEYWAVVSTVFEGRQVDCITSRSQFDLVASTSVEASINNKVFQQPTYLSYEHCAGNCLSLFISVSFRVKNHCQSLNKPIPLRVSGEP